MPGPHRPRSQHQRPRQRELFAQHSLPTTARSPFVGMGCRCEQQSRRCVLCLSPPRARRLGPLPSCTLLGEATRALSLT